MCKFSATDTSSPVPAITLSTVSRRRALARSSRSLVPVRDDPLDCRPASFSCIPRVATRLGAIVGGQTSCKDPEIKAFEEHLPSDVDIVSCHSLHGPNLDPRGQPLVLIK